MRFQTRDTVSTSRQHTKILKNHSKFNKQILRGIEPVLPHITASHLSIIWLGIALSYVVFGITGFGTALVASPLLAQFMPVGHIVPLLALLDFFAATTNLARDDRQAELGELKRLVPLMIVVREQFVRLLNIVILYPAFS
jgi:hypothetical protein